MQSVNSCFFYVTPEQEIIDLELEGHLLEGSFEEMEEEEER